MIVFLKFKKKKDALKFLMRFNSLNKGLVNWALNRYLYKIHSVYYLYNVFEKILKYFLIIFFKKYYLTSTFLDSNLNEFLLKPHFFKENLNCNVFLHKKKIIQKTTLPILSNFTFQVVSTKNLNYFLEDNFDDKNTQMYINILLEFVKTYVIITLIKNIFDFI